MTRKHVLITVLVVALVIVGFLFIRQGSNSESYVADVSDAVDLIETELEELDSAVESDSLTPEQADVARERIIVHLNLINEAASSQSRKLTEAQKQQLFDSLERLKQTLTRYSATLSVVDVQAAKSPRRRSGGGGGGSSSSSNQSSDSSESLEELLTEAIDDLEEHVEDVIEEDELEDEDSSEDEMTEDSDDEDEDFDEVMEGDSMEEESNNGDSGESMGEADEESSETEEAEEEPSS